MSNKDATTQNNLPLIAIVGQTASGKSAIALEIARKYKGEIISADSWTVRQELDIGTAKPSSSDKIVVPHHLIDIVTPCQNFTAAEFQKLAYAAINDVYNQGKVPIIVGGTGLYVDSVLYGFSFAPAGPDNQRDTYNKMTIQELLQEAESKMLETSSIDTRNKRRIIRLLETNGATPARKPLRTNALLLGLKLDKEELHKRIQARVELMLQQGLEQEARALSQKYGWSCEGMKGIGYIEWKPYFEGSQTIEQTRQRIISSTRQLAKRQETWFKRNSDIVWCSDAQEIEAAARRFLKTP